MNPMFFVYKFTESPWIGISVMIGVIFFRLSSPIAETDTQYKCANNVKLPDVVLNCNQMNIRTVRSYRAAVVPRKCSFSLYVEE